MFCLLDSSPSDIEHVALLILKHPILLAILAGQKQLNPLRKVKLGFPKTRFKHISMRKHISTRARPTKQE